MNVCTSSYTTILELIRSEQYALHRLPRIGIGTNKGVRGDELSKQPICIVVVFDLNAHQRDTLYRSLYQAQQLGDACRIVLFTCNDLFSEVRPYGWPVEHIVTEERWYARGMMSSWEDYVRHALQSACDRLGATTLVVPDAHGNIDEHIERLGVPGLNLSKHRAWRGQPSNESSGSWRAWGSAMQEGEARIESDGGRSVWWLPGRREIAALVLPPSRQFDTLRTEFVQRGWSAALLQGDQLDEGTMVTAISAACSRMNGGSVRTLFTDRRVELTLEMQRAFDFIAWTEPGDGVFLEPIFEMDFGPDDVVEPARMMSLSTMLDSVDKYADRCSAEGIERFVYAVEGKPNV